MARRHRRFHGISSISLGAFPIKMGDSVRVKDVAIGAGLSLVVSGLLKGLLNTFLGPTWAQIKGTLGPAVPLVTGLGAGAALYYGQKGSPSAKGHAVGAIAAGVTLTVASVLNTMVKPRLPAGVANYFDFSEVVAVNLGGLGGYGGLLVNDRASIGQRRMNGFGVLINDSNRNLNELAAYSMGDADGDDVINSMAGR